MDIFRDYYAKSVGNGQVILQDEDDLKKNGDFEVPDLTLNL